MVVEITGKSAEYVYDKTEKTVEGFDTNITEGANFYNSAKLSATCPTSVKGTNATTYYMGLDATKFNYDDDNINARFIVKEDGKLVINPEDVNDNRILIKIGNKSFTYNKTEQGPDVIVYDGVEADANKLLLNRDYTLYGSKATLAGEYELIVKGIGNYTGE